MNEELFAELLENVREGAAIMRGDQEPSRKFIIEEPERTDPPAFSDLSSRLRDPKRKHSQKQKKYFYRSAEQSRGYRQHRCTIQRGLYSGDEQDP